MIASPSSDYLCFSMTDTCGVSASVSSRRRFLRETLKMSNAEDLNRLTACSLVLLGHIFYVLGNHRVSSYIAGAWAEEHHHGAWPFLSWNPGCGRHGVLGFPSRICILGTQAWELRDSTSCHVPIDFSACHPLGIHGPMGLSQNLR